MSSNEKSRWRRAITVNLRIKKPIRIGGTKQGLSRIDLPLLKRHDNDGYSTPVVPSSSFKGVLRASSERAVAHLVLEETSKPLLELFGSPITDTSGRETQQGLVLVYQAKKNDDSLEKNMVSTRTSISINNEFGTNTTGSLWQYEFIEPIEQLVLGFEVHFLFPINPIQAAVLLAGIRFLKYGFIGGMNSRGMGLISSISIEPSDFVDFAEPTLREILA